MHIGYDVDGVMLDSHQLKKDLMLEEFGIDIPVELCRQTAMVKLGEEMLCKYLHVQKLVYENPEYHHRLQFNQGALETLIWGHERGYEQTLITSRRTVAEELLDDLLAERNVYKYADLLATGYIGTKLHAVRACDVYVDDDVYKAVQARWYIPHVLLLRQAHNRSIVPEPPIVAVEDFYEVRAYIEKFDRERCGRTY